MNRLRRTLAVNGVASILTVIFILSMTAVPVLAKAVGSITGDHIMDGTITNIDVAGDAAIDASKINRAGLDADTLDGSDSTDFAPTSHEHDISSAHDHDSDYLGVTGPQSISDTLTVSALSYDTTKTGYYSMSHVDFEDAMWVSGVSGSGRDKIPVNLPHGATVTEVQALMSHSDLYYYYLYGPAMVRLYRANMSSGASEEMAKVQSEYPGEMKTDTTIISPRIDNSTYGYYVSASSPYSAYIVSARITYTYTTPVN